jgi:uncharacterized small protein (DUF1192 family)
MTIAELREEIRRLEAENRLRRQTIGWIASELQ